jgi:glucose-6-phosphate-specific signal transduction histidine kinase
MDLVPLVRDEVYRIAVEALCNAFHHAHAKRIEVEIHYDKRRLRMRIRDDGKGISQKVLGAGGRAGHGLPGMQERAALVNGKLSILSGPNLRGQGGADDSGGHRLSKTGWRQIRRLNPYRSKPPHRQPHQLDAITPIADMPWPSDPIDPS